MAGIRWRWFFACASLVTITACGGHGGVLEPRFVAVHNTLSAMGLAQAGGISQGSLPEGADARIDVELTAGNCYTFFGLGGDDVADLDLSVVDARNEALARDRNADRQAAVHFCPRRSGDYQLVVHMADGHGSYAASMWQGGDVGSSRAVVAAAGGSSCEQPLDLPIGQSIHGSTRGATSAMTPSCAQGSAPEVVYRLVVEQRAQVTLELEADYDGVLYILRSCNTGSEVACNDDFQDTAHSRVDATLQPGTYYVVVDGYGTAAGNYDLVATVQPMRSMAEVCADAQPLSVGRPVNGSTATSANYFQATCAGGANAPDQVHRLDVPQRSRVRVHQHTQHDGALYIRQTCEDPATELVCNDDYGTVTESLVTDVLDPGQYFVVSDGYSSGAQGASGDYVITAELAPVAGGGASADACGAAGTITPGQEIELDTFEAADDLQGSCGGVEGPDVVHTLTVTSRSNAKIILSGLQFDAVAYVQRTCGDATTEVACTQLSMADHTNRQGVLETILEPGTYSIVVDGRGPSTFGKARLSVQLTDLRALERSCRSAPLLRPGRTVNGTTAGRPNDFEASCAAGARSGDAVYRLRVTRRQHVVINLSTDYDGALHLRRDCLDRASELGCNDDNQDQRHSRVEADLDPGTYYVVVDGWQATSTGSYSLEYTASSIP